MNSEFDRCELPEVSSDILEQPEPDWELDCAREALAGEPRLGAHDGLLGGLLAGLELSELGKFKKESLADAALKKEVARDEFKQLEEKLSALEKRLKEMESWIKDRQQQEAFEEFLQKKSRKLGPIGQQ